MREGSALLDRLEKRFDKIDSRADRRSRGMRARDSFLGHFSERMRELESLVQVPEMSAFRRLPKVGSRFDPWGNIGGWSVIKDLTYLEWLNEQDIEVEQEAEAPRVSAWGTASGRSEGVGRRSSAWLNTPYTPARVAGKPNPKPISKTSNRRVRSGLQSKRPRKSQALAPTMRVSSPLQRVMGRAAVSEARNSQQSRVMGSLPPLLSKTVGAKWTETQAQAGKSGGALANQRLSTVRRSPMFKLIDEELTENYADAQVSQTALAKGRLGSSGSSKLTQSSLERSLYQKSQSANKVSDRSGANTKAKSGIRGLQSLASTSEMVSAGLSSSSYPNFGRRVDSGKSASTGTVMAPSLQRVIRTQMVQTVDKVVPSVVQRAQKSVRNQVLNRLKNSNVNQRMLKAPSVVVTEVVDVIQRSVLKQAEQEIQRVFSSASIQSLEALTEQMGTVAKATERVERVVKEVINELVEQNSSIIETAVESVMTGGRSADTQNQPIETVEVKNIQQIVRQLRTKGVGQQLAERMATSLPPTEMGIRQSVERMVEQFMSQDQGQYQESGLRTGARSTKGVELSQANITKKVRSQLQPLFNRLNETGTSAIGEGFVRSSILPAVAGERFEERIVADVVNEISKFARRETVIEGSAGQRQLMDSLEKSVGRLVSKTRTMNLATGGSDWVDVRAFGNELDESAEGVGINGVNAESKSSPWFTRETESTGSNKNSILNSSAGKRVVSQQVSKVFQLMARNPGRLDVVARKAGLKLSEVQEMAQHAEQVTSSAFASNSLSPTQQAAARVLKMVDGNPTRPEVIARQTGLKLSEVQEIVRNIQSVERVQSKSKSSGSVLGETFDNGLGQRKGISSIGSSLNAVQDGVAHPLEKMWERATSPIALPEWTGMGTSSFKPMLGESAKGWRLSPKRRAMHPYSVDVDSTVLQSPTDPSDVEAEDNGSVAKPSPWFSKKDENQSGFGFVPQSISGDAKLSTNEIAMFGQAKSVQLSIGDIKGQQARWLEPNRTAVLDNGTVIHAKVAKRLGLAVKSASKQNLPLSWTLEGLQLKSDHQSLPSWAKRASGRPQVTASPEFLVALAKTSSAEEVAEVILQNSGRSQDGILPRTAMTAIDQIRREAHRSLQDMQISQEQAQQQASTPNTLGRSRRRRVSRTAYAVADGLTGLKPLSTASPSVSGEAQNADKVGKLARQLESLVSMAESNRRDEARDGVRMAEESHDAIAEGQALSKGEERDYAVDIEALRQEVMSAFEQEMSLRSLRSFDNSQNTDPWW